jgi:hypothetical protein
MRARHTSCHLSYCFCSFAMLYSWIASRIQNCLSAPANSLSSFWIRKSVALAVDDQPIERQPVGERPDNLLALQAVRDETGKRNQCLDWSGGCKPGKSTTGRAGGRSRRGSGGRRMWGSQISFNVITAPACVWSE